MSWIDIYHNKDKHVVKDSKTGKVREVIYDQKYRETMAKKEMLQPVGKDKREWFDRNPGYKENSKGEIYSIEQKQEEKHSEEKYQKDLEKEEFEKRKNNIDKKYY